jgi:hypothetical protein
MPLAARMQNGGCSRGVRRGDSTTHRDRHQAPICRRRDRGNRVKRALRTLLARSAFADPGPGSRSQGLAAIRKMAPDQDPDPGKPPRAFRLHHRAACHCYTPIATPSKAVTASRRHLTYALATGRLQCLAPGGRAKNRTAGVPALTLAHSQGHRGIDGGAHGGRWRSRLVGCGR